MSKSLIVGLLVVCLATSAFGLTMKVEPKTEECFTENLVVGDDVEARWGVQDGGLLDIDVRVRAFRDICVAPSFTDFKRVPHPLACTDKSRTLFGPPLFVALQVKYGGQIIWQKLFFEGKEEGYYKIIPSAPGAYAFCFSNEMSRFTVKTVRFEFSRKNRPAPSTGDHARPGMRLFLARTFALEDWKMDTNRRHRGFEPHATERQENR